MTVQKLDSYRDSTPPLIAVVGMGCVFPGAENAGAYWRNILDVKSTVADAAASRWPAPVERVYGAPGNPDRTYSRMACLVRDFQFHAQGFHLPPDFCIAMDPLHQWALEAARQALPESRARFVNPQRAGIYLAAIALPTMAANAVARDIMLQADPQKISRTARPRGCERVVGSPAALVAAALGLKGGSLTLDAACASSLYALKLACDELRHFRKDVMLAGGVNGADMLYTQIGFSQLMALSRSGRCAPFDASADGLVVGEGAGMVALKRLDDALRDGDTVYAVIRGIGLSNDMRGNLLAPESAGQLRAMRAAYVQAGWSPESVDYIECHGAGTPVGDSIELQSLRALWEERPNRPHPCVLGSTKSMIGHLLTAAGAAGMIRTLLAMQNRTLPPTANFKSPPPNSPLGDGLFRIAIEAAEWIPRDRGRLRAAVSAFGFGGINAHVLLESWSVESEKPQAGALNVSSASSEEPPERIAIVGMDLHVGGLKCLGEFEQAVFQGRPMFTDLPQQRFRSPQGTAQIFGSASFKGAFVEDVLLEVGEFQIPPGEIPDILPQQLLMLKTAAGAMRDAGLPLREPRERMGAVIGIAFDYASTNFHLRWNLADWAAQVFPGASPDQLDSWLAENTDRCGPPLTASRTLGALGGIVASRIAREFRFGGPSFVVSAEEASGMRAVEIGARLLQERQLDAVLVGSVDLHCDERNLSTLQDKLPLSPAGVLRPFDQAADGTLPGEGAAALVLKRYSDACADGDRIYAVIDGIGAAGGDASASAHFSPETYKRSLAAAFAERRIDPQTAGLVEAHGSGIAEQDDVEAEVLNGLFTDPADPCEPRIAVGVAKAIAGHTGAASGLVSTVKAALCLHHRMLAPAVNFKSPRSPHLQSGFLYFPHQPAYWAHDRIAGPRTACCAAVTIDGNCMHLVLREPDTERHRPGAGQPHAPSSPVGPLPCSLFILSGATKNDLIGRIDAMKRQIAEHRPSAGERQSLYGLAREWHRNQPERQGAMRIAVVSESAADLNGYLSEAARAVKGDLAISPGRRGGICYRPSQSISEGELAFVFPGSGNHYVGMGRRLGAFWPDVLREMDAATDRLEAQMLPRWYDPRRHDFRPGWETETYRALVSDPLRTIFGQVLFGSQMALLLKKFGIRPHAAIGYSLGESAGLFGLGAWPDRGAMLERLEASDLFKTQLAGPCLAVRQAWQLFPEQPIDWKVAAVNRSAEQVDAVLPDLPYVRRLIVNTPAECVIGGLGEQVVAAIEKLACDAIYLDGVVAVHCDAALPVAADYKELHRFPASAPEGIRFYSCARGSAYALTSEAAADSILQQALGGFDFPRTIRQAYADGVRMFLEVGPHASCTRMIGQILQDQAHIAVPASVRGEDECLALLKCLGVLAASGVALDPSPLYRRDDRIAVPGRSSAPAIRVPTGGPPIRFTPPRAASQEARQPAATHDLPSFARPESSEPGLSSAPAALTWMLEEFNRSVDATAQAHQEFLKLSEQLSAQFGETLVEQDRLLRALAALQDGRGHTVSDPPAGCVPAPHSERPAVAFDREQCLEFATGSVARVLGPAFAVVDTYKARVRLPDEPLMLVDRIVSVEGEPGSMGQGRVVTEHDVLPEAWYLDGGRAPVCIAVEAGQADLFLSGYLGIDHHVKGERTYRLLDAEIVFHRGLPRAGETIRYDIHIDKFVRQDATYLFFFRFEGHVGAEHLISMTDGCAGFFTEAEVAASGGILLTEKDRAPGARIGGEPFTPLLPQAEAQYGDQQIEALRRGDLGACFGSDFAGIELPANLRLPGGRMRLIQRIIEMEPHGGRFGLGRIRAEADIQPDDWFLICHFVDDMVMPGTLMYECCAHTLRVLLLRFGWVGGDPAAAYEPVPGVACRLKCRGPVTPATRHVHYEVEIKEIGYRPEPYVLADAHMYADGRYIVFFKDMSMQMSHVTREAVEHFWRSRQPAPSEVAAPSPTLSFTRDHILQFAVGRPSLAFGPPYAPFDQERVIARLPGPPYCFIDRIPRIAPPAWILKPGGWIEAEYDVPPDEWYFAAERSGGMPFCVLLEIALQPCGWLAAYLGSALRSAKDLKFRNLGGEATIHAGVGPRVGTLTMRTRVTKVSEAADMIIEHFDFEVLAAAVKVYTGTTYFGFFTAGALANQVGLRENGSDLAASALLTRPERRLADTAPNAPDEAPRGRIVMPEGLRMPAKALRMMDRIEIDDPHGGPHGLGWVRGIKNVDPDEWFFKAHFFQDPVWPGSLGVEAFLQLIKYAALSRWPQLTDTHRFEWLCGPAHRWQYRGQVLPANHRVTVDAVVTSVEEGDQPSLQADGWLHVDGRCIYKMEGFGVRLVRIERI